MTKRFKVLPVLFTFFLCAFFTVKAQTETVKLEDSINSKEGQERVEYILQSIEKRSFQDVDNILQHGEELYNIADLFRQLEKDSADKSFARVLQQKREVGAVESPEEIYFGMSKRMQAKGLIRDAITYSDSALAIAVSTQLVAVKDLHEHRSKLYEQLGEYDKALGEYKAYKNVNDSIFSLDNESVIDQIQAQFKAKGQKQETELLNQKRKNQKLLIAGLGFGAFLLALLGGVSYNRYQIKMRSGKIIREKSEALERSNKELKELSDFKQEITNTIIHDIKTPLAAILNLSNRIEDNRAKTIARAGYSILRLITKMLDVEKYQHTQPDLVIEKVLLSELIDEAKLATDLLLHDKSVRLIVEGKQDIYLMVDQNVIVRVLVNLLSNAIKFSPPNDEITLRTNIIKNEEDRYVEISIIDHGPGISKEKIHLIVEKFHLANARKLELAQSTGLDLTFCKMAVAAHNGSILVASEKNKGSTFSILLKVEALGELDQGLEDMVGSLVIPEKDRVILRSYSPHLKALKVFNVGSIMNILDEIDSLGLESKWTNYLRSAIKYSNEEQYKALIKIIEL